jgi:hypothetical protein
MDILPYMILQIATKHYLNSKLKDDIKLEIVGLAAYSSRLLAQTEKHLPILENFFFKIINSYFSA